MTKGTSTRRKNRLPGSLYGNFDPGNNDKLMISYKRQPSHDYTMNGACGVLFEGEIHFFGGHGSFDRQHFIVETQRNAQLVKMKKQEDLRIGFEYPSCSSSQITGQHFPWFRINVVILCFDLYFQKSCYSFNGKLIFIDCYSNYKHYKGGLAKYKEGLLTVGGYFTSNQKTDILKMDENNNCNWALVEQDFKFIPGNSIIDHSLVTIESNMNEEYVLLIGGRDASWNNEMKNVFKFNGTWFSFGQLKKPRCRHNSIYWNDAVYVIGGNYYGGNRKMEIWNLKDSPDQFKTEENWPELFGWDLPHLFIVPDSFFPDH